MYVSKQTFVSGNLGLLTLVVNLDVTIVVRWLAVHKPLVSLVQIFKGKALWLRHRDEA